MSGSGSPLERLMSWYASECNGDWEHRFGISLGTLDNPGWHLKIELTETSLEGTPFEPLQLGSMKETFPEPDMSSWIHCKVESDVFEGACGPFDLDKLITMFVDWADAASKAEM